MFGLESAFIQGVTFFADTSSAITAMRDYVTPVVQVLSGLAGLVAVFFIVQAGYMYITSSGKPDQMEHAKEVINFPRPHGRGIRSFRTTGDCSALRHSYLGFRCSDG